MSNVVWSGFCTLMSFEHMRSFASYIFMLLFFIHKYTFTDTRMGLII